MEKDCKQTRPRSKDVAASSSSNVNAKTDKLLRSFPAGYQFCPFDYELINEYLAKRAHNENLPPNSFLEINIKDHHPETLARNSDFGVSKLYFFTPRERKYKNGRRPNRTVIGGYWKATRSEKPVHFKGEVVGYKTSLVFFNGKHLKGKKTDLKMNQYRLEADSDFVPAKDRYPDSMQLDDCFLCKIYKKSHKKLVVVPPHQGNQFGDQAAGAPTESPKEEVVTEKPDLPRVDQTVEHAGGGPFTSYLYGLKCYGVHDEGYQQKPNYNYNPFQHDQSHGMFSNPGDFPPLPLQMPCDNPFGFGFSQQDLMLNSCMDYVTSSSEFENLYHYSSSVHQQYLGGYANDHMEGFSDNYMDHVSPFPNRSIFEALQPQDFNMGRLQVDLKAVSPMLLWCDDQSLSAGPSTSTTSFGHPPVPMKKFWQMDQCGRW